MTLNVVRLEDAAPQAWRNGGGVTRELLTWPNADDWIVRLSVADIEKDGPFSAFPGVQRWIIALTGEGMGLGEPCNVQLEPGLPVFSFDGQITPTCTLTRGPTTDLNLMISTTRASGWLRRMVLDNPSGGKTHWLASQREQTSTLRGVFSWLGTSVRTRRETVAVPPRSLVWSTDDVRDWSVSPVQRCWGFQCDLRR